MNSLAQIREYFPDLFTRALAESDFVDIWMQLCALPYASVAAQLTQIANRRSIKTIDYFGYDYYYAIDCSPENVFVPSEPINGYSYCFKIDNGIFFFENLSYDSDFSKPVRNFQIMYDGEKNQFFLAMRDADWLLNQPKALFAEQYHHMNVEYHFLEFFRVKPLLNYETPVWPNANGTTKIFVVPADYNELEYVKAQVSALMYCAVCGGSPDSLDNLFAIAFRREYSKEDGVVLDFDDTSIWIDHSGQVLRYYTPLLKGKFRQRGYEVRQYEALETGPVELVTVSSDPARFTQLLTGNYAAVLRRLVDVASGEEENALVFDDPASTFDTDQIRFDMGGHLTSFFTGDRSSLQALGYSDQEISQALETAYHRSSSLWEKTRPDATPFPSNDGWRAVFEPFIVNYPNAPQNIILHDYHNWYDLRFGRFAYEMFKNVVIWETRLPAAYHSWISNVLAFFKPLHLKYVASPMNGFVCADAGYGKMYGRYYGGTNCSDKRGYGQNYGRRYGGGTNVSQFEPYVEDGFIENLYIGER